MVLFLLLLVHFCAGQFAVQWFADSSCSSPLSKHAVPFLTPQCVSFSSQSVFFSSSSSSQLSGLLFASPGCLNSSYSSSSSSSFPLYVCVQTGTVFARVSIRARTTSSPIIGIVGEPSSDCESKKRKRNAVLAPDQSCFSGYYADWLYQAGARVVPLPWNSSAADVAFYGSRLNGILFTGGGLVLSFENPYVQSAKLWFDFAVASAATDDPLVMYGTCQGFQLLNVLAANTKDVMCLECFDSEDISLPLSFTPAANFSFYRQLSDASQTAFQTKPISMNFHHDGIEPSMYNAASTKFPRLPAFFRMLSTNKDRKGRSFVSSVVNLVSLCVWFSKVSCSKESLLRISWRLSITRNGLLLNSAMTQAMLD